MAIPRYVTPGQLIQELLDRRGWSRRVLAVILDIHETGLNRLIAGQRPVDAEMAIQLGEVFGIRPELFLHLQRRFDLAQARLTTRPDPDRATRAKVFGEFPVAEMIKRGWLNAESIRDIGQVQKALLEFFKANSLEDIDAIKAKANIRANAKKTGNDPDLTPQQLAWVYRVKSIAEEMIVPKYSASALRHALEKLSNLRGAPELARKVPRILAECGIRFVVVESLTSAKIDGIAFWLDEHSPVIGMTMRHDRIDNFWFVLRHEIEHILRRHGQQLDIELEGDRAGTGPDISEEELEANTAAEDFCVPKVKLDSFIAKKFPFFAERDILGFANTLKIHPGLVAGQLQHKTKRYDRFRNHLVKIRSAVAPSAMVDGWGDVAPVGM